MDRLRWIYTRLMNPTTDVFERRVAELDGGVGALAVSSGQAAVSLAILNIARAGDEVVAADNLYGGTYNLFNYTLPRLGVKVTFVPSNDLAALDRAINPRVKAVFAESIGNPKLDVAPLRDIADVARAHRVPFILDNTVSPYLLRPFEHGVNIAVYSARSSLVNGALARGCPDVCHLVASPERRAGARLDGYLAELRGGWVRPEAESPRRGPGASSASAVSTSASSRCSAMNRARCRCAYGNSSHTKCLL